MGNRALTALTALLLSAPTVTIATKTQAQTNGVDAVNRVAAYTAWDDNYLYLAVQVNKPQLVGTNTQPFSNPRADDAVILSLQTDNDKTATMRTAKTYTLVVSEAGGVQLYRGEGRTPLYNSLDEYNNQIQDVLTNEKDPKKRDERFTALSGTFIGVAVNKNGATRTVGSPASGYTLEVRVPWSDFGMTPTPGTKWGFHLAAQSIAAGSPPVQALSKKVLSASDLDNPSLWAELTFANAPTPAEGTTYYSPRIIANKPNVDGELKPGEYSGVALIEFGERIGGGVGGTALPTTLGARVKPMVKVKPARKTLPLHGSVVRGQGSGDSATLTLVTYIPAAKSESRATNLPTLNAQLPTPIAASPLTLAKYVFRYQGDTRRSEPADGLVKTDGATAISQHPLGGVGAWLSYERVDWHRKNLMDAKKAGIDALLAVYRGAESDRKRYADRGLMTLVSALQSLRNNAQDYPQIALWFDLSGVAESLGKRVDLRDPAALAEVAAQIATFYRALPEAFRLRVTRTDSDGLHTAYPVVLANPSLLSGMDAESGSKLRAAVRKTLGVDLLLMGEMGLEAAGLDGILPAPRGTNKPETPAGALKIARVNPGYDPTYAPAGATDLTEIRPNLNGETYRKDWEAALAKTPDVVVIDSWNEYTLGSAIAPTFEAGVSLIDLTRLYSGRLSSAGKLRAKIVSTNAPEAILPGQTITLETRVTNAGTTTWGTTATLAQSPVVLRYKWLKGDAVVSTGATSAILSAAPDETITVRWDIAAIGTEGKPLNEGQFTLEVSPEVSDSKVGDTNARNTPLEGDWRIPVKVGQNAVNAYALSVTLTDLPTQVENGGVYTVHATVRNDGATTWKKSDGAYVALRLTKGSGDTETYLEAADASVELANDVAPGSEIKVTLTLPVTDASGEPLKISSDDRTNLRWEIGTNTGGALAQPAPVSLEPFDFGVHFTVDGSLPSLLAERRLPIRLSLQNVGSQIWRAQAVRVGYHWLYADGTEFVWEDETTGLPKDVAPGETVTDLYASVTAPPNDGTYWLVWDVKVGDTWASTAGASRVSDTLVHAVRVTKGRLFFADLTKGFNLDGITDEGEFLDGDFDGQGHTFPAPVVPPYTDMPALPSGMWLGGAKIGPDSERRIAFRWGSKDPGTNNFVECRGQRLDLMPPQKPALKKPLEKYRFIHILAASTGAATGGGMKVIFQEPTSQTADLLSFAADPWTESATVTKPIGFLTKRRHSRKGVERVPVALYHYVIKIGEARTPVALVLPDAPEIKIAAVTLEK